MIVRVDDCIFADRYDRKGRMNDRDPARCSASPRRPWPCEVVVWQGSHNGFDESLAGFCEADLTADPATLTTRRWADWVRIWAIRHEAYPFLKKIAFVDEARSVPLSLRGIAFAANEEANLAVLTASRSAPI